MYNKECKELIKKTNLKGVLKMSKIKVTRKAMKEEYSKIIGIGYCNAQYLLKFEEPFAYSTRAEGWACDYYNINGVLISTGYSHIDSKNAKTNYETTKKFEDKAREIACNYNLTYEEQKEQITSLLNEFVSMCINTKEEK